MRLKRPFSDQTSHASAYKHTSRRRWQKAAFGLVMMSMFTGCGGLNVRLSEQELQEKFDARLPIKKSIKHVIEVKLDDARVDLRPGSDRLYLELSVFGKISPLPTTRVATAQISSEVAYREGTGDDVADNPRVEALTVTGSAKRYRGKIEQAINLALTQLGDVPLHRFEEGSKERYFLKEASVKDEHLVLRIGL